MRPYILDLIAANTLFGVSYSILISLIESKVSPQQLFILFVITGFLTFIIPTICKGEVARLNWHQLLTIALSSTIAIYGWSYLTLLGGEHTSAINIAAISTMGPSITILAAAIADERRQRGEFTRLYCGEMSCRYYPSLKRVKSQHIRALATPLLLLSVVVSLTLRNVPFAPQRDTFYGEFLITCGVVAIAISTVIIKDIHRHLSTSSLLGSYFVVALVLLPIVIPDVVGTLSSLFRERLNTMTLLSLIYLPTIGMTLPLYLLYRGSRQLTPLHTALYRYIQPIIALAVIAISNKTTLLSSLRNVAITLVISLLLLIILTPVGQRKYPKKI